MPFTPAKLYESPLGMSDKNKTEIYKTITINVDGIDDKTIKEWKKIEKAIKRYETQFMNLQLAEDVEKMIKEHNDRTKD